MDKLFKAFQILGELMNEDCFDFIETENLDFEERKEYLRNRIINFFQRGESSLCGIILRENTGDFLENIGIREDTFININNFFNDEELVADVILFMDEDMYYEFLNEINNR